MYIKIVHKKTKTVIENNSLAPSPDYLKPKLQLNTGTLQPNTGTLELFDTRTLERGAVSTLKRGAISMLELPDTGTLSAREPQRNSAISYDSNPIPVAADPVCSLVFAETVVVLKNVESSLKIVGLRYYSYQPQSLVLVQYLSNTPLLPVSAPSFSPSSLCQNSEDLLYSTR